MIWSRRYLAAIAYFLVVAPVTLVSSLFNRTCRYACPTGFLGHPLDLR